MGVNFKIVENIHIPIPVYPIQVDLILSTIFCKYTLKFIIIPILLY